MPESGEPLAKRLILCVSLHRAKEPYLLLFYIFLTIPPVHIMAFMELAVHVMCSRGVLQYLVREYSWHIALSCLGILKEYLFSFFPLYSLTRNAVCKMCIVHVCVPE